MCLALAATNRTRAGVYGNFHPVGEAVFVGGLAAAEGHQRDLLAAAA